MTVTVSDIVRSIDAWAPFGACVERDNVGILTGDGGRPVTKVMVALDITSCVTEQAQKNGCELIVSHHPVIFSPLCALPSDHPVYELARRDIAAIAAHTNVDFARGGLNDALCGLLGLTDVSDLPADTGLYASRIGILPEAQTVKVFAAMVKEKTGCGVFRCAKIPGVEKISRVAVCGGAGTGDFLNAAAKAGADALVTADVRHHEWLEAARRRILLMDAGHFATEKIFKPLMAERLRSDFPGLPAVPAEESEPFTFF